MSQKPTTSPNRTSFNNIRERTPEKLHITKPYKSEKKKRSNLKSESILQHTKPKGLIASEFWKLMYKKSTQIATNKESNQFTLLGKRDQEDMSKFSPGSKSISNSADSNNLNKPFDKRPEGKDNMKLWKADLSIKNSDNSVVHNKRLKTNKSKINKELPSIDYMRSDASNIKYCENSDEKPRNNQEKESETKK